MWNVFQLFHAKFGRVFVLPYSELRTASRFKLVKLSHLQRFLLTSPSLTMFTHASLSLFLLLYSFIRKRIIHQNSEHAPDYFEIVVLLAATMFPLSIAGMSYIIAFTPSIILVLLNAVLDFEKKFRGK